VSFNWIHKKTNSRLKQQYVDPTTGEKVEKEDMIKGYEFSKGQYVTFTPDEIKAMEEKKDTGMISISEFVPADEVERLYFERGYFIGPDKGGEKAYKLLSEALKKTGLVAIGQYVARGKQYLIMLRPKDGGLVLETLHYADELRSMKDVDLPDTEVKPAELSMALQLIEQLKKDKFTPDQYHDTVKDRIKQQIDAKVAGEEIVAEPTEAPETQIIDLMEALKASLASSRGKKPGAPAKAATVKPIGKKKKSA
jgi:DNA end-binding protein Ku